MMKILAATLLCFLTSMTFASVEQPKSKSMNTAAQNDLKRLQTLWQSYQHNVTTMNKALPDLKSETDAHKKNASISVYNQKLEQTKNALNQLILSQSSSANKLRQQMIEHATKYQGVYKLAAIENPNTNQLNVFNRLNDQTSALYQQMLSTAQALGH